MQFSSKLLYEVTYLHDWIRVSSQNATDKTPMYEMPLTWRLGVGVLGLGRGFFVLGFWAMTFFIGVMSRDLG